MKWGDIAYNFMVGGDGAVYEGRGWDKQGAHSEGSTSILTVYENNFNPKISQDTTRVALALLTLENSSQRFRMKSKFRLDFFLCKKVSKKISSILITEFMASVN
jgi:hypothetical protein